MTPLEKSARAMAKRDYPDREWGHRWFTAAQMDLYRGHALAALTALEPDEEMIEAGHCAQQLAMKAANIEEVALTQGALNAIAFTAMIRSAINRKGER